LTQDEKIIYDSALRVYSSIMKKRGNASAEIQECISVLEYFEDYEKCKDLLDVFNDYNSKKQKK
jgi:hypothetical protein